MDAPGGFRMDAPGGFRMDAPGGSRMDAPGGSRMDAPGGSRTAPTTNLQMNETFINTAFAGLYGIATIGFLILSYISHTRGPDTQYKKYWTLLCTLGAGFSIAVIYNGNAIDEHRVDIGFRIGFSLAALALYVLLRFGLAYIEDVPRKRLLTSIGSIWLVILQGLFWTTDLIVTGKPTYEISRFVPAAGPLTPFYVLYCAYCWFLPSYLLFRTFRASKGQKRIQMAYLLASFVMGGLGSIGLLMPGVFSFFSPSLSPTPLFAIGFGIFARWCIRQWAGLHCC